MVVQLYGARLSFLVIVHSPPLSSTLPSPQYRLQRAPISRKLLLTVGLPMIFCYLRLLSCARER